MSYGLNILNDAGEMVIDELFENHLVLASGSYTQTAMGVSTITFSACDDPPLVFVNCSGAYLALYGYTFDGSGKYVGAQIVGDAAATVNYFIAAPGSDAGASSDTWGLRVWTAAGGLVFDSGMDYLKILDSVSYTTPGNSPITVTHVNVSTPYYCLNAIQGRILVGAGLPTPRTTVFYIMVKANTTTTALVNGVGLTQVFGEAISGDSRPTTQSLVVASPFTG